MQDQILLIRAFAAMARIEAMKAENKMREMKGESLAYTEEHFFAEAAALEELARY